MNVKKLINEINRSGIMLVILGALFLLTLDDFISSFIGVCLAGSGIIIGYDYINKSSVENQEKRPKEED